MTEQESRRTQLPCRSRFVLGSLGAIVGIGVRRLLEAELKRLDIAHPYVAAAQIGEDPRRRPVNTDCIPGFIREIVAHTLCIRNSNLVGSVLSFNITKCEPRQESARNAAHGVSCAIAT